MAKKQGKRTIILENKPNIISYGSAVGKKEHEGPLSKEFDFYTLDSFFVRNHLKKQKANFKKLRLV